jgi:hypothetical protein
MNEVRDGGRMDSFLLNLTLVVTRREDGTLLARAKELPVMVAARDLAALTRKFAAVAESINTYLSSLPEAERAAYLKEHGVTVEPAGAVEEFSVPVLVGA